MACAFRRSNCAHLANIFRPNRLIEVINSWSWNSILVHRLPHGVINTLISIVRTQVFPARLFRFEMTFGINYDVVLLVISTISRRHFTTLEVFEFFYR